MTARAGMTEIVAELRALCAAGTADYTIAGVAYWTDDQIQAVLDQHRSDWVMHPLFAQAKQVDGTTYTYDYFIPSALGGPWEREASGSAYWRITDSTGAEQGTALYSVDWDGLKVTFAADQAGTAYYLSGRTFDLNGAAAAIWRRKAAYYAADVDWSTDGHRVNASQARKQCLEMAAEFEALTGGASVQMVRADLMPR